jgi:VanZ family protein
VVALATLAYGGAIEIVQPITGRAAEWADLLADGAGAFAGAFVASRFGKRRIGGPGGRKAKPSVPGS